MTEGTSRRSFLKNGMAAGAAVLVAEKNAQAAPQTDHRKYRLGVFGLDFTFWGIWANILQGSESGVLNMVPTHVWDKDREKAKSWADKWGWEVVDSYDGMVSEVDAIVNGDLNNVPWQHKLMRPYLEAGMPCCLQRPWASKIGDLDEMLDLAAKHSAPLIATATYEHYDEADTFAKRLGNVGEIQTVFAQSIANDRPHFHIPQMMQKILGYNVEQVSMWTDNPMKLSYLQTTYLYGASEGQKPFACVMEAARGHVFRFEIIGRNGVETAMMPDSASQFMRFFQQLHDIQKTIETRQHYQPLDIVRKKFECVLAEHYSHYERGGAPVAVGGVPSDWGIPPNVPGWYDDSDFK